jgi:hypothetical protein
MGRGTGQYQAPTSFRNISRRPVDSCPLFGHSQIKTPPRKPPVRWADYIEHVHADETRRSRPGLGGFA